ncbi:MAG: alpha-L-fucosidase [Candidatus Hydrogenedentes bacterium]|nr:alpha-L-fucosidase [Candidatus Hydrogenedentota bacterium]
MFKAENWDPEAWADLFAKSGAKYVVPVAEHHDGFAMYDSSHTEWDAVQMGPHRDTVGELAAAVRKRGLKLGVSSHYAFNWNYYTFDDKFDTADPANVGLYGRRHAPDIAADETFMNQWYARTTELVDKYQPDLFWFDFCFNRVEFEPYRQRFAAYYYNKGIEWGKGVAVNYKDQAFPPEAAVLDIERGKLDVLRDLFWQTDTSISVRSWGYIEGDTFRPVDSFVDDLIDIVSKNGCLLLNVGPRPDGTIPQEAQDILLGIGKWLDMNGEAIYGTRPWLIYGEGPTEVRTGSFTDAANKAFTPQDLRFTTKNGVLYAIALAWPEKPLRIQSLGAGALADAQVKEVRMLGVEAPIVWKQEEDALVVTPPAQPPCECAYVFKITLDGCSLGGVTVAQDSDNEVTVTVKAFNHGATEWSKPVDLFLDGKAVSSKPLTVKPSGKETTQFVCNLDTPGMHRVGAGFAGKVCQTRAAVNPRIALEGEWKFSKGDDRAWKQPGFDDSGWERVNLPAPWETHSNYTEDNAYGWYRKTITVPKEWKDLALVLPLGKLDDADETFFNGDKIGKTGQMPPKYETAFQTVRRYNVPREMIKYGGENVIAIRVYDEAGAGGLIEGPLGPVEIVEK